MKEHTMVKFNALALIVPVLVVSACAPAFAVAQANDKDRIDCPATYQGQILKSVDVVDGPFNSKRSDNLVLKPDDTREGTGVPVSMTNINQWDIAYKPSRGYFELLCQYDKGAVVERKLPATVNVCRSVIDSGQRAKGGACIATAPKP